MCEAKIKSVITLNFLDIRHRLLLVVIIFENNGVVSKTSINPLYNLKLEYIVNLLTLKFEGLTVCTEAQNSILYNTNETRVISKVPFWSNI